MKQKRLEAICNFLDTKDKIIDIGCDHAYVCIEMARRGAKKILGSDIHEKALQIAKENIAQSGYLQIKTALSDGLKKIDSIDYDTLILAGMGASTILSILSEKEKMTNIQKIVIQSNNDHRLVREFLTFQNFALVEETVIYEKKHYYPIMKWVRGEKKLSEIERNLGLWKKEHLDYYQYLLEMYGEIQRKLPNSETKKKKEIKKIQKELKIYLKNQT